MIWRKEKTRMSNELALASVDSKSEWDDLLPQCRLVDLQQTWAYGQAIEQSVGWKPVRQVVSAQGRPVAIAQTLTKDLPVVGPVARMQHGPMLIENGEALNVEEAVAAIDALRRHWVNEQGMTLHLTPSLAPSDLPEGWSEGIGLHPSDEALWRSIRLDLSLPSDELRANMKSAWRRRLGKAERGALEAEVSNSDDDFEFFLERYSEAVTELGIPWPTVDLVRQIRNADPSSATLIFAVKDGERIAGLMSLAFCDVGYEFVLWQGPRSRDLLGHNFLLWQTALHHQKNDAHWCDLGGIDPESLTGITQFKRGLNGVEYELIGNYAAAPDGARDRMAEIDHSLARSSVYEDLGIPGQPAAVKADDVGAKVAAIIGEFVRQSVGDDVELTDDLSLLDGGFLDSLSIISIIQGLQDAFDIQLGVADITIDNFDTLPAIAALVRNRLDAG